MLLILLCSQHKSIRHTNSPIHHRAPHRKTTIHAHTHTYGQARVTNWPNKHVFRVWDKGAQAQGECTNSTKRPEPGIKPGTFLCGKSSNIKDDISQCTGTTKTLKYLCSSATANVREAFSYRGFLCELVIITYFPSVKCSTWFFRCMLVTFRCFICVVRRVLRCCRRTPACRVLISSPTSSLQTAWWPSSKPWPTTPHWWS